MTPPDTIAAVASAAGRGAVGVIRVSGTEVPRVAVQLLGVLPSARSARLCRFLADDGATLDQGLALYFPAPASFTGEHVLELQGHGGSVVLQLVMQRLLALGCRQARPGEFSERAFLNGKMDVAQAEAVADLIDAGTSAAARAAVRSMQGEFSARVQQLQTQLTELRIYVEAAIDFPDEEIDFLSGSALSGRLSRVFSAFAAIKAAARHGTLLREGLTVVIAGRPNVGKSSLLNRLVGDEVAIVMDLAGTTRDVLRQYLQVDGLPLHLIDTAGLRTALDVVEEEGIRRARAEMRRADLVIYVSDARSLDEGSVDAEVIWQDQSPSFSELADLPAEIPVTWVINKIDLAGIAAHVKPAGSVPRLYVSARTGEGVELLRSHLKAVAGYSESEGSGLSARQRHLDALNRAESHLQAAADALKTSQAFELFAEDLRHAQRALGEITGEFTSEDMLGEIFGSFCIGK